MLLTAIAAAALAAYSWTGKYWGIAGRIHLSLIAVAGLALTGFPNYWNLVGWKY